MDFLDELQNRILPGDGAMGTLLMERGIPPEHCFEELCFSKPEMIAAIHAQYIAAGARVIETNSFAANAFGLERYGLAGRAAELNETAARLARGAANGKPVYVAGSVGPIASAEQALERGIDRAALFAEQIGALAAGGVDLLFLETFLDFDELLLALGESRRLAPKLPVIASLASPEEGRLASGLAIGEAVARLRREGAAVVGLNCIYGPSGLLHVLEEIPAGEGPLAAYPNAGHAQLSQGRFLYHMTPEYFAHSAREFVAQGVGLIGGCCGTRPEHIAAMAKAVEGLAPVTHKPVRRPEPLVEQSEIAVAPQERLLEPTTPAPWEVEEESILDKLAAGKQVILAELDPPKAMHIERYFKGACAIARAGADVITLADNSLAILRVGNLALGSILKQRYNITPLLHVSCRDRNLLGLQSELLGMAALGMRHVLPLTGDPSKAGDHPGAKSVYDVNSIELMKIIRQLNEGVNYAGKAIKYPTKFVYGCTFNPNAKNLDAQVSRLGRKIEAGASYVMTQPVFDPALAVETARRLGPLGIPVFVGVWPLLNGRQTEFLHNEVPGITIPDPIRARMAGLEGEAGKNKGLEIAREMATAVLDHFPGIYLITPFLNYELTVELTQFVRNR
ncbi:MAG TPA: bifunctional homocysteine S-methyltransferase/methylenetetrahydrofolate reductase [Chthoniobacteraceae bacterium]|nr:bifunctional homocysteine S-methyltransferase/methylenetetrahydrofolate reductase [Chthoniobacteraceae bacterium]